MTTKADLEAKIRANFLLLLHAGTPPCAGAIAWMLYQQHRLRVSRRRIESILKKLRKEQQT
jgi:hypothetical protein